MDTPLWTFFFFFFPFSRARAGATRFLPWVKAGGRSVVRAVHHLTFDSSFFFSFWLMGRRMDNSAPFAWGVVADASKIGRFFPFTRRPLFLFFLLFRSGQNRLPPFPSSGQSKLTGDIQKQIRFFFPLAEVTQAAWTFLPSSLIGAKGLTCPVRLLLLSPPFVLLPDVLINEIKPPYFDYSSGGVGMRGSITSLFFLFPFFFRYPH